jgi:hypothetical protein
MPTTTVSITSTLIKDVTLKSSGTFRITSPPQRSQTLQFFDDLYTYPPKFRVKWNTIDELYEDPLISNHSTSSVRFLEQKIPFLSRAETVFQPSKISLAGETSYSFNSYLKGFFNKLNSNRFFETSTKPIQKSLEGIPVYAVLNGQQEMVLANAMSSSTTPTLKSVAYNFCGSFDPLVESRGMNSQLGLFFMSLQDATEYLNEIVEVDSEGTQALGLSIHCFGLDLAYRVLREYHPGIDFRLIPNLEEVQKLLKPGSISDRRLMFDESQQQLRIRRRSVNFLPGLSTITKWISPFQSFLQNGEYFKGVPIYIVKIKDTPRNFFTTQYLNTRALCVTVFDQTIQAFATLIGHGDNRLLQGSFAADSSAANTSTYIFFEKADAIEFCNQHSRRIFRLKESPAEICVFNLEDFLEIWEDTFDNTVVQPASSSYLGKTIKFLPSTMGSFEFQQALEESKMSIPERVLQLVNFKYRRLTGFLKVFLNTNT